MTIIGGGLGKIVRSQSQRDDINLLRLEGGFNNK